jgi:O-antigen biosynthesis protein
MNIGDSTPIFDQFSRYQSCVDIINSLEGNLPLNILDVGSGELCLIGRLACNFSTTYIDPLITDNTKNQIGLSVNDKFITGDIFSDILNDQTFDYVVSVDTFEHISPVNRTQFLERLLKLANKGVIISCPTKENHNAIILDIYLNDIFQKTYNKSFSWLAEHSEYGLPSKTDIISFFKENGLYVQTRCNGHIPWLKELLGFFICSLELNHLVNISEVLSATSSYFIENIYKYDDQTPTYRDIIVATKKPDLLPPVKKLTSEDINSANAHWDVLRSILYSKMFRCLSREIRIMQKM